MGYSLKRKRDGSTIIEWLLAQNIIKSHGFVLFFSIPYIFLKGTIMTMCKDRVKPSPKLNSWKINEIFATAFGHNLDLDLKISQPDAYSPKRNGVPMGADFRCGVFKASNARMLGDLKKRNNIILG
ncbi:ATPase 10, plasma membrane-type isoform X1 [Iris pallida]|uniref:ATPase 10, plasma membrane-type isoform X1 n=1 Tax=Iris pallida TaxID=29817 RepID=A0AAX6GGT8_IRIPA|nr:ATPase 10, plasma membrane-type isoform X1 [Iris pallida]